LTPVRAARALCSRITAMNLAVAAVCLTLRVSCETQNVSFHKVLTSHLPCKAPERAAAFDNPH
jgi:hypothetical protein